MFNDYLSSKDCHLKLERSFYGCFQLTVQASKVSAEVFKAPYYNTFFQMVCHLWVATRLRRRALG